MRQEGLRSLQTMQKLLFFMRILPKSVDGNAYLNGPLYENFLPIAEGDIFDLGGMTAQAVELPGHTPGSIGLLVKERRVLLVSDATNAGVCLFLPESCKLSVYQSTLRKIDALEFDWLLTGHDGKLIRKAALKDYIAVAENPDFEHGKPGKESGLVPGVEYRFCRVKTTPGQRQTNRATIAISRDKLDV